MLGVVGGILWVFLSPEELVVGLLGDGDVINFIINDTIYLATYLSVNSDSSRGIGSRHPIISSIAVSPSVPSSISFYKGSVSLAHCGVRRNFSQRLDDFACFRSAAVLLVGQTGHYFPVVRPVLGTGNVPSSFGCLTIVRDRLSPHISSPTQTMKA